MKSITVAKLRQAVQDQPAMKETATIELTKEEIKLVENVLLDKEFEAEEERDEEKSKKLSNLWYKFYRLRRPTGGLL